MKRTIDLSHIKTFDLFDKVLSVDRKTNLFQDLRTLYTKEAEKAILTSGITKAEVTDNITTKPNVNAVQISPIPSLYEDNEYLDVEFCAGYGVDARTLTAISYQHRPYHDLPSLDTFIKRENFSIGNFGFLVDNDDYEIEIITNNNVKIIGYSYQINAKKRKSFIAILGVHFDYNSILKVSEKYNANTTELQLIDVMAWRTDFPQIFMCRITGDFYVCNCFKNYIDWKDDFFRIAGLYEEEIIERLKNVQYLENICHYCNKTTPITKTALSGYSDFLLRYAPYFHLECKKRYGSIYHFDKEDRVNLENELREYFGYAKIGEKWTTETQLYNLLKEILPNNQIVFHYRGKEMQGLEIDIFVPELKLAIEYQGEQHYKAIEHWGGKDGLEQRQRNDRIKLQLCKENGYNLVEFSCYDEISRNLIIERIENFVLIDSKLKREITKEEKQENIENTKPQKEEIDCNLCVDYINAFLSYRIENEQRYFNYRIPRVENGVAILSKPIFNCLEGFKFIANKCIINGKFKDTWEYNFSIGFYGPELHIKSKKTKCEYILGFEKNNIFLTTFFWHSENIRYMGDDFWKILLNLSDIEGFKYDVQPIGTETEKSYSELFVSKKSIIFQILRKYFFDKIHGDSWDYLCHIELQYSSNKDFNEIIKDFGNGLKMMYQLNYMLWKVSDLKSKTKN
jgi:hypothetical protein